MIKLFEHKINKNLLESKELSFKSQGVTYKVEKIDDAGSYIAKWSDDTDNGLGYNNKGFIGISKSVFDKNKKDREKAFVVSSYDRLPSRSIQNKLIDIAFKLCEVKEYKYSNRSINISESIWGDSKPYDSKDGWTNEDIEFHKSIDWKSINWEDVEVPEDKFIGTVTLYSSDGTQTENVEFHKFFRANPIYAPYYKPVINPFKTSHVGFMYDGNKRNGYMVMDRAETQDVYDILSK